MQQTLILVLGKRLVNNRLTPEGQSRVAALVEWLATRPHNAVVVGFCGGRTDGQSKSEASAMADAFRHQCGAQGVSLHDMTLVLEEESTNTIENIECMARTLIESGIFAVNSVANVIFVSSDYHLKRIFGIQTLMDEQGLLRVLKQRCDAKGLRLNINMDLNQHILAAYPYCSDQAALFLLMDEITPYRVYLEGVVSGVFQRPLALVREVPYNQAENALSLAQALCRQRGEEAAILTALFDIEQVLLSTTPQIPLPDIKERLGCLHTHLTRLNRLFDSEQPHRK